MTADERGAPLRVRTTTLLAAFLCIAGTLVCGTTRAAGADETTVMVLVNGTPITDTMVKDVVKSLIATHEGAPSSDEIAQLTEAAIESLIDLELLYDAAQAAHVQVSDEDVKREIAKSGPGRATRLPRGARRSGLTEAELRRDAQDDDIDKLVEQQLMKDVRVSPEGAALHDEHQSEFQRGGKLILFDQAKPAVGRRCWNRNAASASRRTSPSCARTRVSNTRRRWPTKSRRWFRPSSEIRVSLFLRSA
jgi:hypothetical protein